MKPIRVLHCLIVPLTLTALGACGDGEPTFSPVATVQQKLVQDPPTIGAAVSGNYRNLFVEWLGESEAAVDTKIDALWAHYFEGGATAKLYYPDGSNSNGPKAYIYDTGNRDIRSEGMGYGMMIAVQMDEKSHFDAIWNWAKTNMQYKSPSLWEGYFGWQANKQGNVTGDSPASDGEEYIATALFFAAHRWGNGSGIYDYEAEANTILNTMLHKEDMNGGVIDGVTNMFDATEKQVVFVPYYDSALHTDPSYHLPAFYELWAEWAEGWNGQQTADRQFWADAASASRAFFGLTTHPNTGLSPDYAYFTGEPHPDWQGDPAHMDFRYDAWRTAVNWAVDYSWWAADPSETVLSDRILEFFYSKGLQTYGNLWTLDGTTELGSSHSLGLVGCNGAAALAANATTNPNAHAVEFVSELWNTEPQYGNYRYYDGLLQFMAFLHVAGRFQAIMPGNSCMSTEVSCIDGEDNDCDGATDCADSDCDGDPACDSCGNGVCGSSEDSCTCDLDCGAPPATEQSCIDGEDNDCDGATDCADSDCDSDSACDFCGNGLCGPSEDPCTCSADCGGGCTCSGSGTSCTDDSECCNGKCKGPPTNKTCN